VCVCVDIIGGRRCTSQHKIIDELYHFVSTQIIQFLLPGTTGFVGSIDWSTDNETKSETFKRI